MNNNLIKNACLSCILFLAIWSPVISAEQCDILIKFKPNISESKMMEIHSKYNAVVMDRLKLIPVHRVTVQQCTDINILIQQYESNAEVEYAEKNRAIDLYALASNDPLSYMQYALHNVTQTGGLFDADIDVREAWGIQTGSSDIIVAVSDSGVDYTHEDLQDNIWINTGEIPDNKIDDDNNGYTDDIRGWSFYDKNNDPADISGHGTHVAGIIAAKGNNAIGISGVGWDVKIMPVHWTTSFFQALLRAPSFFDAALSIEYSIVNKAHIINASWGKPYESFNPDTELKTLREIIKIAGDRGILLVAASGNSGKDTEISKPLPCGFDLENVICVAATDANDVLTGFSNYGATSVDLAAPGDNILSTVPFGHFDLIYIKGEPEISGYMELSGTSMAAPHVSGTAALILSQNKNLSPEQVKRIIMSTVDPLPSLIGKTVTGGRLNAGSALNAVIADFFAIGITAPATIQAGRSLRAIYEFSNNGFQESVGSFVRIDLVSASDEIFIQTLETRPIEVMSAESLRQVVANFGVVPPGVYKIKMTVDSIDSTPESNEDNNIAFSEVVTVN